MIIHLPQWGSLNIFTQVSAYRHLLFEILNPGGMNAPMEMEHKWNYHKLGQQMMDFKK